MIHHAYYTSIDDLPLWNWEKLKENGNPDYLVRKKRLLPSKKVKEIHEAMQEDFYQRFGKTDKFLSQMKEFTKEIELICDAATKKDPFSRTQLKILQIKKTEEQAKQSQIPDVYEIASELTKHFGRVNPKEVTVSEFYSHLKNLERQMRRQKQPIKKK